MKVTSLAIVSLLGYLTAVAAAADMSGRDTQAEKLVPSFKKLQLSDKFWAEGVAIADVNRDGHMDIISGPYWYEWPDFKKRHEIFPATHTFTRKRADGTEEQIAGFEGALGVSNAYSDVQFVFVWDFNGDGWPDVLTIGFPGDEAAWYENPGPEGKDQPWKRHVAFDSIGNESPTLVDVFKDGHPVIVCMSGDYIGYVAPDGSNPRNPWRFHAVSQALPMLQDLRAAFHEPFGGKPWPYAHGLGVGDVNGDGRLDILSPEGWWEQPVSVDHDPPWKFHPWSFLRKRPFAKQFHAAGAKPTDEELERLVQSYKWPFTLSGSQIYVYDVNGDGLPDIVSSLDAHGYGLAWFEQLRSHDGAGEIQFKPHFLMGAKSGENPAGVQFTQLHAVELADLDGSGLKDIVTGKRFWAHGRDGPDPESNSPAVLYEFTLVREPNGAARFVPYLIDANSGVGTQIAIGDVNGDGLPDVVTANKKGLFIFLQEMKR
jgi:hypothetical protein